MILKVDLSKAFDRANWLYIYLMLTHLGFPFIYIKWTMSCITNVSYSVLLNGAPTLFFSAERGLRQGCLLSPLLFLLIMEGLSRIISVEHRRGKIVGIKIMDNYFLTHLLFVDDVLIFLNESIGDTIALQNVFGLFQKEIGIVINIHKSTLTPASWSKTEVKFSLHWGPFTLHSLEVGLKYLGFRLKPKGYRIADWTWPISKVEKHLNIWYHRYLALVGKLVLIKAILEVTPVCWMSLAWIPRVILVRLQNICSRFLWKGNKQGSPFLG